LEQQKNLGSWLSGQKENIRTVVIAIILAVVLRTFIIEPRYIPSASMEPTLQIEDRIIVEKISNLVRSPQRGEILVFYPPNSPLIEDNTKAYIKRVVGLPGELISINDGRVFINGQPLTEPYIAELIDYSIPINAQIKVPEHSYWMMGDNRNNSNDSHVWGFLPEQNIVGRAVFRFFPLDERAGLLQTPKYQNSALNLDKG
jgi:signal peptidase I